MIEYIKGELTGLTPTEAIVEAAGVGYCMNITLPAYTALERQHQAKLFVHEVIREDAHSLFGFVEQRERSLFRELISVSGVGANTARMILSSVPASELEQVIVSGDERRLKAVKGVGGKTAQRIIVDLKDKIKPIGDTLIVKPAVQSETFDEALAALVMLGFTRAQSQKALNKLFAAEPDLRVETAIKRALSMM